MGNAVFESLQTRQIRLPSMVSPSEVDEPSISPTPNSNDVSNPLFPLMSSEPTSEGWRNATGLFDFAAIASDNDFAIAASSSASLRWYSLPWYFHIYAWALVFLPWGLAVAER